jgi:hypothetical protein
MTPPISTEIDQHFGDPRRSSSIHELHGEPKILIDFPSWKSALNAIDRHPLSVSKTGVCETAQALISRFDKLWTEEGVQWRTDARVVRIIWGY